MACHQEEQTGTNNDKGFREIGRGGNMAQKKSRRFTVKDVEYVHKNYAEKTAAEIATARKLSLFQINKIVSDLRKAGVDLPKKKVKRVNPVKQYVETLGTSPKGRPRAKKTKKK